MEQPSSIRFPSHLTHYCCLPEMFTHWWTVVRIPPCAMALQCYDLARRKGVRRFPSAVLVAPALLIAACATQTGGASVGVTTTATGQPTPMTIVARTPTVTPKPSSGLGQIVLLPGSAHYAASDDITVTIRNSTRKTACAEANFTDCSIILVERFVAGSWQPVNPCANGYPHPLLMQIMTGTERVRTNNSFHAILSCFVVFSEYEAERLRKTGWRHV